MNQPSRPSARLSWYPSGSRFPCVLFFWSYIDVLPTFGRTVKAILEYSLPAKAGYKHAHRVAQLQMWTLDQSEPLGIVVPEKAMMITPKGVQIS